MENEVSSGQKRKHQEYQEAAVEDVFRGIEENGHLTAGSCVPTTSKQLNLTGDAPEPDLAVIGKKSVNNGMDHPAEPHDDDEAYFHSYSDVRCHLTMIEDHTRTFAYKCAILRSYKSLHRRRVLDVGAGSAILSVFCAQAGAREVVALEASATMSHLAQQVVKANGYEKVVKVINKYAEVYANEVTTGSSQGMFDALVSEWMGYALLSEWMLESVLVARDKLLKPGGLMFPQTADIYLAPASEDDLMAEQLERWTTCGDQFKVNLDPLAEAERKSIHGKMVIRRISPHHVMARSAKLLTWDLRTVPVSAVQQPISAVFRFNCFGQADVTSFVLWFQVGFPGDVNLTTSPYSPAGTHWHQTVLYLPSPLPVEQDSEIYGSIILRRSGSNRRCLEVELTYGLAPGAGGCKKGTDDHNVAGRSEGVMTCVTFDETLTD